MEVLVIGNEILRQKADPIEDIKTNPSKWKETAEEMFAALKKHKGVGLAGPQVGISRRIFVVDIENDEKRVFINPSIVEMSQETAKLEEGCLSIPGNWADVVRPAAVKVQAWNEDGRAFTIEASGILARVILHEYDHLEGVLFVDRLPELKRGRILEKIARKAKAQ
jgi:peptide deformylase